MAEMTIQQTFDLAVQHHQAGRLQQAEQLYRRILAVQPDHADALHLLGVIAAQVGRFDIAVDMIRKAIVLIPDHPAYHSNLGNALREQGQLDQAIFACRTAIRLKPDYAEAHSNLGNALRSRGQLDQAIASYRRAIQLKPDYPEAHSNLGVALRDQGQLDQAIFAFRAAIQLNGDYAEAHSNLGIAHQAQGQLDQAIFAFRAAIQLKPGFAEAQFNLGNALSEQGQPDMAIFAFRAAIQLKPDFAQAHCNLGTALGETGCFDDALACFQKAAALRPDSPDAHSNLGNALKNTGRLDEALASYRRAMAIKPDFALAHSNLLGALQYHPGYDAASIFRQAKEWDYLCAGPLKPAIPHHPSDPSPDRRLRIGYVSPDLRDHVVGRFLLPLLTSHDHANVEIFAYAQVPAPDAMTQRLAAHVDVWRDTAELSDEQVAEQITQDRIDILVDLSGHTAGNRLLVFARKPAPVQVTWLGYPGTTGLGAMDYRLTDAKADPPGRGDEWCVEKLVRLPDTAWCWQRPDTALTPGKSAGPFTFGSFNNFAKITDDMLRLWARILKQVPDSRLMLKAKSLGCPSTHERVRRILAAEGINADRLILSGWRQSHAEHLATYNQVDVALDTFPYHGTTTTCEALWMGVPVVTLAGAEHRCRVGVSLLTSIGHPEWIAADAGEYVRIAASLAEQRPSATALRQEMEQSPLMDGERFARHVEAAYRQMWRRWCEQKITGHA